MREFLLINSKRSYTVSPWELVHFLYVIPILTSLPNRTHSKVEAWVLYNVGFFAMFITAVCMLFPVKAIIESVPDS